MSTKTDLDLPLYASKPQRRIPGTTAVAVTMYRSSDNTVREYAVIDSVTGAHLGTAYYQPGSSTRARGYAMVPFPGFADEVFANLTKYATEIARRNEIDVKVGA